MAPAVPFQKPTWFIDKKVSNPYGSVANAILPYLSPENQRSLGTELGRTNKDFESYGNAQFSPAPSSIGAQTRRQYLSSDRATQALAAVERMRTLSGKSEKQMGKGYTYLVDVIKTLQRLGGMSGSGMSRANYQELYTAVQNFTENTKLDTASAPYAQLANYFVSPTFSAGPLVNNRKIGEQVVAGSPNRKLY